MKRRALDMARRGTFLAAVAIVFAAMAVAVLVREVAGMVGGSAAPADATPVVVAQVAQAEFADVITAAGNARANESVAVTSKVADIVKQVLFDSGDFVESGQLLAELVDTEEAAARNEVRTTLVEAERRHARMAELAESGYVAAQLRDEAESDAKRAQAQLIAVEARMTDRKIRAPFSGVVGLRNITAGERIGTDTVIATLNDVSLIKVDFAVPERFLSTVEVGQRVNARVAAYPDEVFSGQVTSIDNQVDRASRSVAVRAEIPNGDDRLVPGMLLSVEVRRDQRQRPAIPESALMRQADQAYVFVVQEQSEGEGTAHIAQRREVDVGLRANGQVEVLAGLRAGELVVSDGTHRTRDGAIVRVSEHRPAGEAVAELTE
ncbi:efflux RND transporter periplasmic adaptor subunit [Luteimonas qiangzhengi]|uniref:efflux RND transporter periplasmic adaptor subunit n=1 Tax=Luteimonas sp. MJ146 TaxID=3129240 RepID=UPI0031BB6994